MRKMFKVKHILASEVLEEIFAKKTRTPDNWAQSIAPKNHAEHFTKKFVNVVWFNQMHL